MARKATITPAPPAIRAQEQPPVFDETMSGALIDAARIAVMAAVKMLPPEMAMPQIVLPGEIEGPPNVHECLVGAMEWLNAARELTVQQAAMPPTSIHVVSGSEVRP